jgi:uncharacterized cupin superfamily protein
MAATPKIIRLEPNGPRGVTLAPLELDPADFQSPLPEQNYHLYFTDPAIGLNVGIWDTTTMQEAFGPYPGDEFILVLTGAFSMLDAQDKGVPAKAGDLVAFRNGAPMSWKQEDYLKKFYLTLRDPEAAPPAIDTAEGGVVVIDPATGLTDDDTLAYSEGTGSGAVEREVIFFRNDAGTMSVGLWDCQAFDGAEMTLFPCHEFVVMAAGEVTIREPGGVAQTFGPGDAFFVPKGTLCSWHVPHYIRKFFAAVES